MVPPDVTPSRFWLGIDEFPFYCHLLPPLPFIRDDWIRTQKFPNRFRKKEPKMGGLGSGRRRTWQLVEANAGLLRFDVRPYPWRLATGDVDVAVLLKVMPLNRDRTKVVEVWRENESLTFIGDMVTSHGVHMTRTTYVSMVSTRCNFGGLRTWAVCPRCDLQVGILFVGADCHVGCRQCYAISYPSKNKNAASRAGSRAIKIRQRLKGHPGLAMPYPTRPKGMHRKTYYRLSMEMLQLTHRWALGGQRQIRRADHDLGSVAEQLKSMRVA